MYTSCIVFINMMHPSAENKVGKKQMAHSTLKNTNVWDELLKMIFFDGTNL
jgi:hypothetical protein